MAVSQSFTNFDTYFIATEGDKIIINDLNYYTLSDTELLNKNLMTVYDSDSISTIPTCDCGYFKGNYKLNHMCSTCGTAVRDPFHKVKPYLWLKALDAEHLFINPTFWMMLKTAIHKKIDYLRYLSDPKFNPPIDLPPYIIGLKAIVGERTYSNLINNIENILVYLINHSAFKDYDKQETLKDVLSLYIYNKPKLYSSYLPIINKKMFVMENTNMGKFTNLAVSEVIDVVMLWIKTVSDDELTPKRVSATTVNTISKLALLYDDYFDKYLLKKPGAIRKHIYGARSHFTFRAVIISIPGPHQHDEIHVPWSIGVTAFRPHLINKLVNQRGYKYKDASALLYRSVKLHSHIIEELLNELINDAPNKRIPVILHRNPSLLQGSTQLVGISKFKNDPYDMCISMSILIAKSPNADFDGDELNVIILNDNFMAEEFKTLRPFYNVPDLSKPFSISGNLTLLSPANNILSNFLSDKEEHPEQDTIAHLL